MNGGSDHFLSRACLADQKHTGVGRRHLFNLFQNMPKRNALADHTLMLATDNSDLLLPAYTLAVQLVPQATHLIESFSRCLFCSRASDGTPDHFNKEPQSIDDDIRPLPLPVHCAERDRSNYFPTDLHRECRI